jgi:zinc transporter 7
LQAAIFAGFFAFFFLDKTMRVLSSTASDGSSKGHSHHHHHAGPQIESSEKVEASSTAVESVSSADGLRSRGKEQGETAAVEVGNAQKEANASLKLSAYLNLFGDFSESSTLIHDCYADEACAQSA